MKVKIHIAKVDGSSVELEEETTAWMFFDDDKNKLWIGTDESVDYSQIKELLIKPL
jgi:hypothetical protein